MRKVLVIFGSKSDKDVYGPILEYFDKNEIDYIFRVCSAHRTPDLLAEILKEDADHDYTAIISGAGLAAHLPGVIASKTIKPVIGVPVHSNYSGLDAFLSIIQMPPGVPVMGVGVNLGEVAAKNAKLMQTQYEYVNLIGDPEDKLVKKAKKFLDEFNITVKYSQAADSDAVNISFINLDKDPETNDSVVIYCPESEEKHDVEYAINLLKHSTQGLWVGLNRVENACISAMQVLNLDHRHDISLENYREKQNKTVKQHDSEEKIIKEHKTK